PDRAFPLVHRAQQRLEQQLVQQAGQQQHEEYDPENRQVREHTTSESRATPTGRRESRRHKTSIYTIRRSGLPSAPDGTAPAIPPAPPTAPTTQAVTPPASKAALAADSKPGSIDARRPPDVWGSCSSCTRSRESSRSSARPGANCSVFSAPPPR